MDRRAFLGTVAGSFLAAPLAAEAQPAGPVRLIGVLMDLAQSDPGAQSEVAVFRGALAKLGWTKGSNLQIELRWGTADANRMKTLAKELVDLRPDAILSRGTPVTRALASQTRTVPIVFVVVADPIGSGFAASLARPGGNITGFSNLFSALGGKWVELLKEIAPRSRGTPVQPGNPRAAPTIHAFHSSRRVIPCRPGECRSGARQGRDRRRYRCTSAQSGWRPHRDAGWIQLGKS